MADKVATAPHGDADFWKGRALQMHSNPELPQTLVADSESSSASATSAATATGSTPGGGGRVRVVEDGAEEAVESIARHIESAAWARIVRRGGARDSAAVLCAAMIATGTLRTHVTVTFGANPAHKLTRSFL